jgi:hypothetical protein
LQESIEGHQVFLGRKTIFLDDRGALRKFGVDDLGLCSDTAGILQFVPVYALGEVGIFLFPLLQLKGGPFPSGSSSVAFCACAEELDQARRARMVKQVRIVLPAERELRCKVEPPSRVAG